MRRKQSMFRKGLSVLLAFAFAAVSVPGTAMAAYEKDNAADVTLSESTAIRSVGFNSATEWLMGNHNLGEWGGSDLLIAGNPDFPGWSVLAGTVFEDSDGSKVTAPEVTGINFSTPRNAVVTFQIPEADGTKPIQSVQLEFTVRNVKQLAAGAKLAVYGNSITTSWGTGSNKTIFGAAGAESGLSKLELLGFTDTVTAGTPTTSTVDSGQTITLKSKKLTEYVKKIAADPAYADGELSFRIAGPDVGGVRIYSEYAQAKPKLRVKYSDHALKECEVQIRTVDGEGNDLMEPVIKSAEEGDVYTYNETPSAIIEDEEANFYKFNAEKSALTVTVKADSVNEILLVYDRLGKEDVYSGNMISEEGAWCWFADPRATHYENDDKSIDMSYIGYIDVHGSIKATQYNHNTNESTEVLIRSNFQPDDHNNPTFLVLPDERVIVFYSRHTSEPAFYYRVTKEPGDLTTLGEEKKLATNHNTTYPSPFLMEEDPDHIYLAWRGINWHPTLAKLSLPDEDGNVEFTWGPKQIVSSSVQGSGVRPYAKYVSDGKSKIHMTYTSTHPDNINPTSIQYSYIDITDLTLRDAKGRELCKIEDGPFKITGYDTDPSYVVADSTVSQRGWVWEIALDKDEIDNDVPVIAMVRISPDKKSHDYYYAKWNGSGWTRTFLTNAGGKFHSSNIEYCYSGGMAIDKQDPKIIYASVPEEGLYGKVYEIKKYVMNEDGTEVKESSWITKNSKKNNVRPYMVSNYSGDGPGLMWMNGDYQYWIVNPTYPNGYPTSIRSEFKLPTPDMNVSNNLMVDYELKDGKAVNRVADQYHGDLTGNAAVEDGVLRLSGKEDGIQISGDLFKDEAMGSFTISMNAEIEESNYTAGHDFKLFDFADGAFAFSVKDIATVNSGTAPGRLPVLTSIGRDGALEANSANILSNSDWCKTQNSNASNRNNMGWTNFTITYDAQTGRTAAYVNGLADISAISAADMLKSVDAGGTYTIGGFTGKVSDIKIFNTALSHYEVNKVIEGIFVDEEGKAPSAIQEKAVRSVGFNSGTEWRLGNSTGGEWSGNDLLISGSDQSEAFKKWSIKAGDVFTDSDGTTVTAPEVTGSFFGSPRNAVVTFKNVKENADKIQSVQLELTVRNVKQLAAGARLAVYGNSLTSPWSGSDNKTVFGASGENPGLDKLDLLGLTNAMTIGTTATVAVNSGEKLILKSQKLTEYVRKIATDPDYQKGELSFRLAGPIVGGIRIYSEFGAEDQQPVLKIMYSDKAGLENAIAEAVPDTLKDYYTTETWDAYENALKQAKEVNENKNASQAQIEAAVRELKEAKDALKESADKSKLEKAITEAEKIPASDEDKYGADAWYAFRKALASAKKVNTELVLQSAVDDAVKALEDAQKALADHALIKLIIEDSTKKEYRYGEAFKYEDLKVTAEYNDGSKRDVSEEVTTSGYDAVKPGTQKISVTFGGRTVVYEVVVNEFSKGYVSTADWTNIPLDKTSGDVVVMEFEINPNAAKIDGMVGYSSAESPMTDWGTVPIALQLNPDTGVFNVRNGGAYKNDAAIVYEAGKTYHIKFSISLSSKTYSVEVTVGDGKTTRIAKDYAFRTGAPAISNIGNVVVRGGAAAPAGQFSIREHKIYAEVQPVDKKVLDAAIKAAVPDTDKDKYTEDSWENYQKALKAAKEVQADKDATQKEADDAAKALTDAQKALKEIGKPDPVDKTALDEAIKTAVTDKDKDKYTKDSWENYQEALKAAKDVQADKDAAQKAVDDAVSALKEAQKALKEKDPENQPVEDIFHDIEAENWFTEYVQYVYDKKIMKGLNETTFGPDVILSRAQFATILHRMENEPETVYENRFPDVPDEEFYTKAVMWASSEEVGVISGYADKTFGPGDNITREQMAVMMYRYAKYKGYDVSVSSDLNDFEDRGTVSQFADTEMKWAVGAGLIKGDDGLLNPQGTTSRAVCATIIQRFMEANN